MPKEHPIGLKERLKKLRTNQKRTLEDVGKAAGVEKQTVHGWESGKSQPSLDALIKLAALFGVTTDALLGVTSEDAKKINHLAHVFAAPASEQAIEMHEKMLAAGYSEKQIQRFIHMSFELALELATSKNHP